MPRTKTKTEITPDMREAILAVMADAEVEYDENVIADAMVKNPTAVETLSNHVSKNHTFTADVEGIASRTARARAQITASEVATEVATGIATGIGESVKLLIETALKEKGATKSSVRRKLSSVIPTRSGLVGEIERYAGAGKAIVPLLILGEQGAGKTYACRESAANYDYFIEVPCHAGMEARDFIGGTLPTPKGLVWTDGGIARAFRLAAAGFNVLLLVDEIFRVPLQQRSIFLTCLSPDETDPSEPVYKLATEKALEDGTGTYTETLVAPCNRLSIVGTTNVGGQFAVSEDDPAMVERWMYHYVYCTSADIKRVLLPMLEDSMPPADAENVATSYVDFWTRCSELRKLGTINLAPTVRTLSRAVRISETATPASHFEAVMRVAPMWAGTDLDGRLNNAQIENIKHAAKESFKC